MPQPVEIDVWSDIACPWCYIGKRRLEAGVAAYAGTPDAPPVEIEYHSFELAPDTPVDFEGSEVDFLVRHKRMSAEQVRSMLDRVTRIAAGEGLDYDFASVRHTNTVKAHQLLHYAKAHGLQLEAKERLLRAYFVEGRHVGRAEDLAVLAGEIGLDGDDVLRSLHDDEYLAAVRADGRAAIEYGIQGVPFSVIDGRYGVSGAQPAEVFTQALTQAVADREVATR
jgi:predicted DsbA family dithiol-disulfide isomerase